jgi:RNA polymerase sigma factor (sigma-70 family)
MKRDVIEPGQKQDDETMLRDFERSGSETAFRELVRRHLGVVLGAAMRRIGDRSLAEEAAQNVFTALASKAGRLSAKPSLTAWLYRATMLECSAMIRNEQSRKRKLEAFSKQTLVDSDGQSVWREALPVLDEAIDALPAVDRHMILLRFFERKSFQQIAASLGKSEDAAQKQCERALAKLSRLLRRKGIAVPVTVLASGLGAQVAQALTCSSRPTRAGNHRPAFCLRSPCSPKQPAFA